MASFLLFLFFTPLLLSLSPTMAELPTSPLSPDSACKTTLYPRLCKSMLPNYGSNNLYNYGRLSVQKALSNAFGFSSLIDRKLKNRFLIPNNQVAALRDCKLLADLTTDYLLNTMATLNSTDNLSGAHADDVQTLLSAIVTNQQTCYEGLRASSPSNDLYAPLTNGSEIYSVSLALVTHASTPRERKRKQRKERGLLSELKVGRDGFPQWLSKEKHRIIQAGKRMLLQSDSVLVNDTVTVAQDGSGNFTTISDAINAAPNRTDVKNGYFVIYVLKGVYEEYVSIPKIKWNLMMVGDGINQTIITGNRSVVDGSTTFNSATFAVVGQGFVAMDMTFRNTAGPEKHQAVAVRNGADLSVFYHCSVEGYQDTLYTHSLRQFYRECDIYGTIDFIFGNAAVVFQNCNLYARMPMASQNNVFTAQGRTDPNQNTGTSILNCSVTASSDFAWNSSSVNSYLGRPWKEYSRTVYMKSFIDSLIDSSGWLPWSGDFALNTLYYGEFNNSGPGADTSKRVSWPGYHAIMNVTDAGNFTVSNFIMGDVWLPATSVEFHAGLDS
ncbi:pectinesterase [Amborella trichopoda]|nr:pectinesterase [Amborella trichopoda]|eukprot:XP_006853048.2 pectinesterase [Amborella trichopoda]